MRLEAESFTGAGLTRFSVGAALSHIQSIVRPLSPDDMVLPGKRNS